MSLRYGTPVPEDLAKRLRGAFAYTTWWAYRDAKITVDYEEERSMTYRMLAGGYGWPEIVNVSIEVPWRQPDPRGPEFEQRTMTFNSTGRLVPHRTPCSVSMVIAEPRELTDRQLLRHALAGRAHLDAELSRGYQVTRLAPPPAKQIRRDPLLLPEVAAAAPLPYWRHTMLCDSALPASVTAALG